MSYRTSAALIATAAVGTLILVGCPTKDAPMASLDAAGVDASGGASGAGGGSTETTGPNPLAAACNSNADCASGFCADSVCCASACDQQCYSCRETGSFGACLPQLSDDDLVASVPCTGAKTCGLSPSSSTGGLSVCALKDLQACNSNSACASNTCVIYYADQDGDGWGNSAAPIRICNEPNAAAPPGFSTRPGDCCDTDASAHPGATSYSPTPDLCGSFDINCDGTIEIQPGCAGEADPTTCGKACTIRSAFDLNPIACL